MDSCSELPLCSGVTGSNYISMSSSWFIVHVCYFNVLDVVLLVVAPGSWGYASLIWQFFTFLS